MIDLPEVPGRIIMLARFGSHLYGTSTESSDTDYKGVFIPNEQSIFLNRIPRSVTQNTKTTQKEGVKNGKDDVDMEIWSLHHFINKVVQGETCAMDMLHIRPDQCEIRSPEWELLHSSRQYAYSQDMRAFIGYARKQAAKYGIKGSRLDSLDKVIQFLHRCGHKTKLGELWDSLPIYEHVYKRPHGPNGLRIYQVCGKQFQETVRVDYVIPILQKTYDSYGARAQQAKENKGIDWKAVSHACRAAIQMRSIFRHGDIRFPLAEAPLLRLIKQGKLDYTTHVAPYLEGLMEDVEEYAALSTLPSKVDRKVWDCLLIDMVRKEVKSG